MDEILKSKLHEYHSVNSSRLTNGNNYTLRSVANNNVTRKQGIYSKFLSKSNVSNGFGGFGQTKDSSRMEQPSTSNGMRGGFGGFGQTKDSSRMEQPSTSNGMRGGFGQTKDSSRMEQPSTSNGMRGGFGGFGQTKDSSRMEQPSTSNGMRGGYNSFHHPDVSRFQTSLITNGRRREINDSLIRIEDESKQNGVNSTLIRSKGEVHTMESLPRNLITPTTVQQDSPSKRTDISRSNLLSPRVMLSDICRKNNMGSKNLERDNGGFLIPSVPIQRSKQQKFQDIVKECVMNLNEIADVASTESAFCFLRRVEDRIQNYTRTVLSNNINGQNDIVQDKDTHINNWLQSSVKNGFFPPASVQQDYAASIASAAPGHVPPAMSMCGLAGASSGSKSSFFLRDWSLIKGKELSQVMITGELLDISSRKMLEENHISSNVTSASFMLVETSCCVYFLIGEFHDRTGSIPTNVKKHFSNGFPRGWKEIIQTWGSLIHLEMSDATARSNRAPFGEVSREEENRCRRLPPTQGETGSEIKIREMIERFFRDKETELYRKQKAERVVAERDENCQRRPHEEDEQSDVVSEEERDYRRDDSRDDRLAYRSRHSLKRKASEQYETSRRLKKVRTNLSRRVLNTPRSPSRLSVIGVRTRSAVKRLNGSLFVTPKSSKGSKLRIRNRRQTPMVRKLRRSSTDAELSC